MIFPFGREVPFSFCIIFGQNEDDLINNARFAQVMYNSRYRGFTPPTRPTIFTETDTGAVRIYWDDASKSTTDVLTGYSDFEGYKITRVWMVVQLGDGIGSIYDTEGFLLVGDHICNLIIGRRRFFTLCLYKVMIVNVPKKETTVLVVRILISLGLIWVVTLVGYDTIR
ncbi:hypothetical protein Ct9H90mP29_01390 [bacterium]|nr:MAG: hypothetical protein Ct9H90mP29_01390 [bacterium]